MLELRYVSTGGIFKVVPLQVDQTSASNLQISWRDTIHCRGVAPVHAFMQHPDSADGPLYTSVQAHMYQVRVCTMNPAEA